MPNPLSHETREAIIYHKKNGINNTEISKWLRITTKSVQRIWKQYREEKSIAPRPHKRGRKPAICGKKMEQIKAKIKEQPDITLEELVDVFDLKISISALSRKLTKADLTFKKNVVLTAPSRCAMAAGGVARIYPIH